LDLINKNMKKQKALVVSGFPGIGKSYIYDKYKFNSDKIILDSDSSKFDKSKFPQNYINHIIENLDKVSIIMVNSHKVIRDALKEANIDFVLVYPDISLKEEYIRRYEERGNHENFIKLLNENWDNWINEIEKDENLKIVKLIKKDYYLEDILNIISKIFPL